MNALEQAREWLLALEWRDLPARVWAARLLALVGLSVTLASFEYSAECLWRLVRYGPYARTPGRRRRKE